ncbi:MAG: hypothetical protein ACI9PY_002331 [Ascidiaceihabitans sp.]|jgi:hypothetical protein
MLRNIVAQRHVVDRLYKQRVVGVFGGQIALSNLFKLDRHWAKPAVFVP